MGRGDRRWWWPAEGVLVAVGAGPAVVGVVDGVGLPEDAGAGLVARGEPACDRVDRRAPVPLLDGVLEGVTDAVGVLLAVGFSVGLLVGWSGGHTGLVNPAQPGLQVGVQVGVWVAVGVAVGVGEVVGHPVGVGHGTVG